MKHASSVIVYTTTFLLLMPSIALSQVEGGDTTTDDPTAPVFVVPEIFTWLFETPINWVYGIVLLVLGVVAAVITARTAIDSTLIGTEGRNDIDLLTRQLDNRERYRGELEKGERGEELRAAIDAEERAASELGRARRRYRFWGTVWYAAIGGLLAIIFAQDLWQALAIGAGGPAFWGAILQRREFQQATQKNEGLLNEVGTLKEEQKVAEEQLQAKVGEVAALKSKLDEPAETENIAAAVDSADAEEIQPRTRELGEAADRPAALASIRSVADEIVEDIDGLKNPPRTVQRLRSTYAQNLMNSIGEKTEEIRQYATS